MHAATIRDVLNELSQELGDALVEVVVSGVPVLRVGRAPAEPVEIHVPLSVSDHDQGLVATVAGGQREVTEQALARARASVRALLLERELDDLTEAAPLLSFAALTGLRENGAMDAHHSGAAVLHQWPSDTPVVAVALRVARGGDDDMSARLGPVVGSSWRAAFPRVPLARVDSGWFAFVPATTASADVRAVLKRLAASSLGSLGVAVGASSDNGEGTEQARSLLRRAWLAARLAEPDGRVVEFHRMGTPLVRRLLPTEDALDLASTTFPELVSDPHAAEVITSVLAYLDCAGSVTAAAERLGIHRNTLQIRLRRAMDLGVQLTNPEHLLSTHLLLASLDWPHPPTQ